MKLGDKLGSRLMYGNELFKVQHFQSNWNRVCKWVAVFLSIINLTTVFRDLQATSDKGLRWITFNSVSRLFFFHLWFLFLKSLEELQRKIFFNVDIFQLKSSGSCKGISNSFHRMSFSMFSNAFAFPRFPDVTEVNQHHNLITDGWLLVTSDQF